MSDLVTRFIQRTVNRTGRGMGTNLPRVEHSERTTKVEGFSLRSRRAI